MPKEENNTLDYLLNIRVDAQELKIFKKKSQRTTGKPYQMLLREMITAFNDGRLRIVPTKEQQDGKLYSTV